MHVILTIRDLKTVTPLLFFYLEQSTIVFRSPDYQGAAMQQKRGPFVNKYLCIIKFHRLRPYSGQLQGVFTGIRRDLRPTFAVFEHVFTLSNTDRRRLSLYIPPSTADSYTSILRHSYLSSPVCQKMLTLFGAFYLLIFSNTLNLHISFSL